MLKLNSQNITSYLALFMLVAQTGFPFFVGDVYLGLFAVITGIMFLMQKPTMHRFIIKYMGVFILLMVLQIVFAGQIQNFGPMPGIILRILYAYLAVKVIGPNFQRKYVKFIYFFTVIGLVFWVILAFVPGAYSASVAFSKAFIQPLEVYPVHVRNNLIIYTNDYWLQDTFPRNAGPFWEAGGYGAFLVVAFLFNTMDRAALLSRKNSVFIIAILTTFSLGAYASFLIFVSAYSFFITGFKNKYVFIAVAGFIAFFAYSFNKYEFLGAKFQKRESKVGLNLNEHTSYENLNKQVGRNEKMRLDLRAFAKSPIFGEGQSKSYKFGNSPSGFTSLLKKWGLVGFLLIFGSIYFSTLRYARFKNLSTNYAKLAVITFMVVGLSQSIWGKPLFLSFTFIFLVFDDATLRAKLSSK